jgi:hypothetical protein
VIEKKKVWIKPELIVLLRGSPEEAVLTGCKVGSVAGSSGNANAECWVRPGSCASCDAVLAS